jgi:hypothetical protein
VAAAQGAETNLSDVAEALLAMEPCPAAQSCGLFDHEPCGPVDGVSVVARRLNSNQLAQDILNPAKLVGCGGEKSGDGVGASLWDEGMLQQPHLFSSFWATHVCADLCAKCGYPATVEGYPQHVI